MEERNERSGVEPVGYVSGFYGGYCVIQPTDPAVVLPIGMALYRAPREWVGLEDEEIVSLTCECVDDGTFNMNCAHDFARAIEARLKEQNG